MLTENIRQKFQIGITMYLYVTPCNYSIAIVFWTFTGKSIWWKKCNELQLLLYLVIDWNLASIYTKWFWQQFYFCCCFLWSRNDRIIILIENRIFSFVGTRRVEKRSFENFFDITSFVWSWESGSNMVFPMIKFATRNDLPWFSSHAPGSIRQK